MKKLLALLCALLISHDALADTKISALPAASAQTGTEVLPEYQAGHCAATGGTCGVTATQLKAFTRTFSINPQTGTTYTLQASDANNVVTLNNASAVTVTVPLNVFAVDDSIRLIQLAGAPASVAATIVGAGGVTIQTNDATGVVALVAQYDQVVLTQTATNVWSATSIVSSTAANTATMQQSLTGSTGQYQWVMENDSTAAGSFLLGEFNNDLTDGPFFGVTCSTCVDPLGHESGPVVWFGCSNHNGLGATHQPCDLVSGDGGNFRIARIGQSNTDLSETEWFFDNHWSGAQYQFGSPTGGYKGTNTTNIQSLFVQGTAVLPNLTGTTGSIGGGSLANGACTSGTVSVTSSTTSMSVSASPVTYPGDGFHWEPYVSTAGTVTVKVCNATGATGTPTASAYNVRVQQ